MKLMAFLLFNSGVTNQLWLLAQQQNQSGKGSGGKGDIMAWIKMIVYFLKYTADQETKKKKNTLQDFSSCCLFT